MSKKINIQINSIYGNLLFEYSCVDNTAKKTVEKAVKQGANLWRADLREADLRGANLWRADLREADLQGADLQEANLQGANLQGADLWRANLQGADLQGAKNWNIWIDNLYSLKMQNPKTKLRYWKYLINGNSPYQNTRYEVGETYAEKDFDTDEQNQCGAGLNVATLMWCLRDSLFEDNIELIEVEFNASDIVAIPYFTDGKFRVKKFKVLRKISREEGKKILNDLIGSKLNE